MKLTNDKIQKAIDRLILNKSRCQQFNFFKEDNHKKIDICIRILESAKTQEVGIVWLSENIDKQNYFMGKGIIDVLNGNKSITMFLYPEATIHTAPEEFGQLDEFEFEEDNIEESDFINGNSLT